MDDNLRFWQRTAWLYSTLQVRSNKEQYSWTMKAIEEYLTSHSSVLELACGTGEIAASLSSRVRNWTATDFSHNMIEQAEKNSCPAIFETADATDLKYDDSSFDIVIIANALHVMPDPDKALKEIRRVLKPHGTLIAPTYIYEGRINRFRLNAARLAGFVTYSRFTSSTLEDFIEERGFSVEDCRVHQGKLLPECFIAARIKR